jgi:hypothetical protein
MTSMVLLALFQLVGTVQLVPEVRKIRVVDEPKKIRIQPPSWRKNPAQSSTRLGRAGAGAGVYVPVTKISTDAWQLVEPSLAEYV